LSFIRRRSQLILRRRYRQKGEIKMKTSYRTSIFAFAGLVSVLLLALPTHVRAEDWKVQAGAQSHNKGNQVLAFLPNELWIHAGDTVNFMVATDEPHTISFLTNGQVRLPFQVGCPGTTPSGSTEDGMSCVNSGALLNGQGYSVVFPTPGNYKLVCLVHNNMTGMIHVLEAGAALPHNQAFYKAEAADTQKDLFSSAGGLIDHGDNTPPLDVTAGTGEITANGGGQNTLSVMRFMHGTKVVRVGATVEWTNDDPITPHTITFGVEPANPMPPSANVTADADGALHAMISSPNENVHSGFILAASQDQIGLPQTPAGVTRFRVTFTKPGIYNYKCVLHDDLGMVGEIVVLP
jgi:plastocyanin